MPSFTRAIFGRDFIPTSGDGMSRRVTILLGLTLVTLAFAGASWLGQESVRVVTPPLPPWISWDDVGTEVLIWPRNTPDVGATAFYGRGPTGTPEFYKHGAILDGITHYARLPGGPTVLPVTASNTHE